MHGIRVNPMLVRPDDKIATQYTILEDFATGEEIIKVKKAREVKRVQTCFTPEKIHLDHECYDTRFGTVILVVK